MPRRRSGFSPRIRSPKRIAIWAFVDVSETAIAAGAAVLLGTGNAALNALRPFTIVRSRGIIFVSDATGVALSVYAEEVIDETQATGGIGVIPTPVTESDSSEFYVYQPVATTGYQVAGAGAADIFSGKTFMYDSKAMRKVGPDETTASVIENTSANALSVTVFGRFLIKLH